MQALTANGVLGDPCQASAGRGAAYLAAEVEGFREDLAALADDDGVHVAAAGERGR